MIIIYPPNNKLYINDTRVVLLNRSHFMTIDIKKITIKQLIIKQKCLSTV